MLNTEEYSYSALVKSSLNKDSTSIKNLSTLKIYDAAGYDHGAILIAIANRIGEKEYIKLLGTLTDEEKQNILSYIEVGLEYGDEKFKDKTPKEIFPYLIDYLESKE